jgi:hypothetical protein
MGKELGARGASHDLENFRVKRGLAPCEPNVKRPEGRGLAKDVIPSSSIQRLAHFGVVHGIRAVRAA